MPSEKNSTKIDNPDIKLEEPVVELDSTETNNIVEPNYKKYFQKKCVISYVIILLILISGFGYAYYSSGTTLKGNIGKAINLDKNLGESKVKQIVENINYSFDIDGKVEYKEKGEVIGTTNVIVSEGVIYSGNDGLNQRILLGKLSGSIDSKYSTGNLDISNLDIISDNENIYIYLEEGFSSLYSLFGKYSSNSGSGILSDAKSSFKENKYIMIDNSKPILNILGDLAQNDTIKQIAIGAFTSSPNVYYKNNGVEEEIIKYITSNKFIDYLFIEGEKDEKTNRIPLKFNDKACGEYASVTLNAIKEFKGLSKMNISLMPSEQAIKECNNTILNLNQISGFFVKMYKEGDIEKGNFKLSINSGDNLDISINYKSNIIDTWSFNAKNNNLNALIKVNGKYNKVLSSEIAIDANKNGVNISGKIINGLGEISIKGKEEGKSNVYGLIKISDYSLLSYKIDGDINNVYFSLNGNKKRGKISFVDKEGDIEKTKLNIEYIGGNITFNLKTKSMFADLTMIFNYKNSKDFSLEIKEKKNKLNLSLKSIVKSLSEIDYSLSLKKDDKELGSSLLSIKKSKESNYYIYNSDLNIKMSNLRGGIEKGGNEMNANLEFRYKEGGAEYGLPQDYNEIDINIDEVMVLPRFSSIDVYRNSTIMGTTGLAIGGTIIYFYFFK